GAAAASAVPALELIAPSFGRSGQVSGTMFGQSSAQFVGRAMAGAAPGGQPMPAFRPAALRAWSPLVPFAAVQAAELMAGVLAPAAGPAATAGAADSASWQAAHAHELVAPWVAPRDLVASTRAEARREPAGDRPVPVPEA